MDDDLLVTALRGHIRKINRRAPEHLPADGHFVYDFQLDSLDLVEFVARIEQEFKVLIPDTDLPQLVSLETTAAYLQARIQ